MVLSQPDVKSAFRQDGELDAAVALRGPTENKHYAAIAALKLKDGKTLEKVLRELREQVPQPERDKIKLDSEAAGSVKIHRLDVQQQFDEQAKKLFGDNPIHIAVRDDALFLTGGEGGLSLLKDSLTSKPGIMPPFKLNLALLIGAKQKADLNAVARKAFGGTGKNNDTIQLSAEGGRTARIRLDIKPDVIKFFSLLDEGNKGQE